MSDRDYGDYREFGSLARDQHSPGSVRSVGSAGADGSTGRRTPSGHNERSISEGDISGRSSRVGDIILLAAAQAQQQENAQATARTAAQIAAQARKMRGRNRRVVSVSDVGDSDMYDMESGYRGTPGGNPESVPESPAEYAQGGKGNPTAKDIRGQTAFTHDGKAYNAPTPPAFALLDIGKSGQRLGYKFLFSGPPGYRVCLWTAIVLTALTAVLGLSILGGYFALDPRQPSYELQEIRIQWWNTYKDVTGEMPQSVVNGTVQPTVYLYANAILVARADNPNKNIALHYENTTYEVSYQGVPIGSATVPPLVQPPNNQTEVSVEWKCNACAVLNVGHYLEADEEMGAVPLQIKMSVYARVELGGVISPAYAYSTTYDVKVRPPPSARR